MVNAEQTMRGDPRIRAVSTMRSRIETVLQTTFGETPSLASPFRGNLSTVPSRVDSTITPKVLMGKCGIISGELQAALSVVGINTDICISEIGILHGIDL